MTALDHAPFLAAVLANPAEDGPRLVYADWLEETGEPALAARGEFIRVQCELARIDAAWKGSGQTQTPDGFTHVAALRRRERELLFARKERALNNGINWLGFRPLTAQMRGESGPSVAFSLTSKRSVDAECRYRRGFVAEVTCTCADWIGGPCRRCGGGQWVESIDAMSGYDICPDCRGLDGRPTGRTQGVGPALVRAAPLRRVVLSDRWPARLAAEIWVWWLDGRGTPSYFNLPLAVWRLLSGCVFTPTAGDGLGRSYPTEAAALDALCGPDGAALRYARSVEPATKEG